MTLQTGWFIDFSITQNRGPIVRIVRTLETARSLIAFNHILLIHWVM